MLVHGRGARAAGDPASEVGFAVDCVAMPYELLVRARFEAAHHLTAYRGAPEPVHGHSWRVEARIAAAELGPEGYAVDFVEIQARLEALAARFRHGDINTVPPFDRIEPDHGAAGGVVPRRARLLAPLASQRGRRRWSASRERHGLGGSGLLRNLYRGFHLVSVTR